jgi:hypothetical protein
MNSNSKVLVPVINTETSVLYSSSNTGRNKSKVLIQEGTRVKRKRQSSTMNTAIEMDTLKTGTGYFIPT